MTIRGGREAEYTHDDRQLLKTIEWETAQIEDRSYNDVGLLTGVDRTYVDETRTYNAGSQLTQISRTNVGSQTYTYDLNGNVTSETLSGGHRSQHDHVAYCGHSSLGRCGSDEEYDPADYHSCTW